MIGIYPKGINPDGDYRMDIEVEGVGEGRQDQLLIRPHPDGLGYTILLNDEDIFTRDTAASEMRVDFKVKKPFTVKG